MSRQPERPSQSRQWSTSSQELGQMGEPSVKKLVITCTIQTQQENYDDVNKLCTKQGQFCCQILLMLSNSTLSLVAHLEIYKIWAAFGSITCRQHGQ